MTSTKNPIPSLAPNPIDSRMLALRLLGRLGLMTTTQLALLAFPGKHPATVRRNLSQLEQQGLIWRCTSPALPQESADTIQPPLRQPDLWGLLRPACTLLETCGAEPDPRSLARLVARTPQSPPLSRLRLPQLLTISWWCSAVLLAVRGHRLVRGVYLQTAAALPGMHPLDALVIIRVSQTPIDTAPHQLRLWSGRNRRSDELDIRLALEVDLGRAPLATIQAKAAAYRELHANGAFAQQLGGALLPVIITPTKARADLIAHQWRNAWPAGWGVVTTPYEASAHPLGVMWGQYDSMITGQPVPLLSVVEQHPITERVQITPGIGRERWVSGAPEAACHAENA